MPRSRRILQSDFPYHVTIRTNDRRPFPLRLDRTWTLTVGLLNETAMTYGAGLLAFVLMQNHLHLIAQTPFSNLSSWMRDFLSALSRQLRRRADERHHLFGRRYHATVIENSNYFSHAYKYLLRNPVAAGACDKIEDYPYSSWRWEREGGPESFLVGRAIGYGDLPPRFEHRLNWLNVGYSPAQAQVIKRALRRRSFGFTRQKDFRRVVEELESP